MGGFNLPEVAFLYGTSGVVLGMADLLTGSLGWLAQRVQDGTFDTFLMRPAPALAQAAADRFAVRRVGRVVQAAMVLGWSVRRRAGR